MDIKRKIRTKVMPFVLKKFWYVNESSSKQSGKIFNSADFVRFSQIDKLLSDVLFYEGNVAELGVYKGRLTELIADNIKCTDKYLYLYDTFEGFYEADVAIDKEKGYIGKTVENFSDTSVEKVIDKVLKTGLRRSNLIIRQGYFPSTICEDDASDIFCFVSIDFDLSKPTKDALEYFWPRVVDGGYIVVHDYGNRNYKGVKKSVDNFIKHNDIKSYMELCDYCGSMIIKKV